MAKPTTTYTPVAKPATTYTEPAFDLSILATEAGEDLLTEASEAIQIDAPTKPPTVYEEL